MIDPIRLYLAGPAGAGKTEVAGILAEQHGFTRISLGDLCREEATRRGWPLDRAHLQAAGDALRGADPALLAFVALGTAQGVQGPVVIEGVRLAAEAAYLRTRGCIGVDVDAPADVRAARLRARDGADRVPAHRTEREAGSLTVDIRILNDHHDQDALRRQVRLALGRAIIQHAERRGKVRDLNLSPGGLMAVRQIGDDLDRIAIARSPARHRRAERAGLER